MPWIHSYSTLASHPKLLGLASDLDVSENEAIGILHRLWWWCAEYAQDGNITSLSDEALCRICSYKTGPVYITIGSKTYLKGNSNASDLPLKLISNGFVDDLKGVRTVHDFDFTNDKLQDYVEKGRERKRRYDAAKRAKMIVNKPETDMKRPIQSYSESDKSNVTGNVTVTLHSVTEALPNPSYNKNQIKIKNQNHRINSESTNPADVRAATDDDDFFDFVKRLSMAMPESKRPNAETARRLATAIASMTRQEVKELQAWVNFHSCENWKSWNNPRYIKTLEKIIDEKAWKTLHPIISKPEPQRGLTVREKMLRQQEEDARILAENARVAS
jgi:hypothetical protein